jgi:hypothetical protein
MDQHDEPNYPIDMQSLAAHTENVRQRYPVPRLTMGMNYRSKEEFPQQRLGLLFPVLGIGAVLGIVMFFILWHLVWSSPCKVLSRLFHQRG